MRIDIKPLSVNQAYTGRRKKTAKYKTYENELLLKLGDLYIPPGRLSLWINIGFSSKGSDIDNALKPTIDILQKKYKFNDNRIYELRVEKEIVKKGSEYISFGIHPYD